MCHGSKNRGFEISGFHCTTTKLSWTVYGQFNGGPLHHLLMESACLFHFPSRTAQAIIFVLDSSDDYRMVVAKDELDILLQHSGE